MNSDNPLPDNSSCPSSGDLIAFQSGDISLHALETIGAHLAECTRCLSTLGEAAEEETSALQILRRSLREPARNPFATDAEYERMEDGAIQLFSRERTRHTRFRDARAAERELPFSFGQYQLVEKIGEGGMGIVYRGLHIRLKKAFAIKILAPKTMPDTRAVARFQREMEAVGRLDHNNIVRATDAGETAGEHFLVMELIDGITLSALVKRSGCLGVADACELVRQAAVGLQCAHDHGMVHRDVKPSNLLLSAKGELKILDLGLALLSSSDQASGDMTLSGQAMGTADYMAPEQWDSSHDVDIRADLYSLGCTLFFLLTGRAPFAAPGYRSNSQKMAAHLGAAIPSIRALRPEVPAEVEALLNRLLAKKAAARYSIPQEVARDIEPFCRTADLPAVARPTASRLPRGPDTLSGTTTNDSTGGQDRPAAPKTAVAPPRVRPRQAGAGLLIGLGVLGLFLAGTWATAVWPFAARDPDAKLPRVPPDAPPQNLITHRVFEKLAWNDLLDRPPTEFVWWNPDGNSHWTYDPKLKQAWVQTIPTTLLSLGQADTPGFTLRATIRQQPWTGAVGLFVAGRRDEGTKTCAFTAFELRPGPAPSRQPFILHRSRGSIQFRLNENPLVMDEGFNSRKLPALLEPRDYMMEIVVSRKGITSVAWDGIPFLALTDSEMPALTQENYRGSFGLFCRGCSVHLMSATFFPTN